MKHCSRSSLLRHPPEIRDSDTLRCTRHFAESANTSAGAYSRLCICCNGLHFGILIDIQRSKTRGPRSMEKRQNAQNRCLPRR